VVAPDADADDAETVQAMPPRSAGLRPGTSGTTPSRRPTAERVDTSSFISEDDLPAWLRQVVETEEAENQAVKRAGTEAEARSQARAAEATRAATVRAAAREAQTDREEAASQERDRAAATAAAARPIVLPPSLPSQESTVAAISTTSWSAERPTGMVTEEAEAAAQPPARVDVVGGRGKAARRSAPLAEQWPKLLMAGSVLLIVVALLLLIAPGLFG